MPRGGQGAGQGTSQGSRQRSDERARRTPPRGPRGGSGSGARRAIKLAFLITCFLVVGFFVVLVVDVGASLAGRLDFGGSSVAELVGKVIDRVLDRDVPRAREPERTRPAQQRGSVAASPRTPRAPEPAIRPEEDARHVEARPDPQVEHAKQRLDEILRRL